jgi:hypothetical protein
MSTTNKDKAIERAVETLVQIRKNLKAYKDHADNLIELAAIVDVEDSVAAIEDGIRSGVNHNKRCAIVRFVRMDVYGNERSSVEIEFVGRASDDVVFAGDVLRMLKENIDDPVFVAKMTGPVALKEDELFKADELKIA